MAIDIRLTLWLRFSSWWFRRRYIFFIAVINNLPATCVRVKLGLLRSRESSAYVSFSWLTDPALLMNISKLKDSSGAHM